MLAGAIAPVQTSLIHVTVGGTVDRSCPVGNRSCLGKNCEWQSVPLQVQITWKQSALICCAACAT